MTIRSRKHALASQPLLNQSLLALATLGLPSAAYAQAAEKTMDEIKVAASAEPPFKADQSASPKLPQALLDTPQSITIIRKEVWQEQGASSLTEALRNTPGITLQLGENGSTSAGDTFQMRGFAAQSSILVDGIRDLGPVSREAFNLEQVEVAKGPAGADIGRGAGAGYVNLVSKLPTRQNAASATASATASVTGGGTRRATLDATQRLGDSGALRLNAMAQQGGQPGRTAIERRSRAVAPALAWGLDTPTRLYLYSQHVRQNNTPDGGLPSVGLPGFYHANAALRSAPMVDRNNYYGYRSDYEHVDADMLSARLEHRLGPHATLSNTTRYGKARMDRILTGVYTINAAGPAATWSVNRIRQSLLQDNTILANSSNVLASFMGGGWQHTVSAGLELLSEEQSSPTRSGLGTPVAPASALTANLYQPLAEAAPPGYQPALSGAYTQGRSNTVAMYAFDTLQLNPQWQLTGGLRLEHFNTVSQAVSLSNNTLSASRLQHGGRLASFKAGLLYKPVPEASLYAAYANAKTPPGSANFSLSAAAGNINGPGMAPQQARNLELGAKWDALQRKLALSAALYRSEHRNEITQLDAATNQWSQLGKRRVQGLELGAVGQLTPHWNVMAGLASMDTRILQGSSGNNAAGAATRWSPRGSATLWTSWQATPRLTLGGGARYLSQQRRVVDPNLDPALQNLPAIPAYAVLDGMLSYKAGRHLTLQVNLYNLGNRLYLSSLNNSGARATLGAPRTAQASAQLQF